MEHFFPRIQVKTKKKRSSPEMEHFFLSTDLRSDAHQSQIIGGDADEDHTVGGIQSNYWGGYILPILSLFGHHCVSPFERLIMLLWALINQLSAINRLR